MNRHCCFHIVLLALMFILFTGGACSGSVWYVSVADGNDSNPGTPSLPFLTIQKAVDTASNGDTVLVENGTYFEDVNVDKDGLTLKSLESTGATIDGTSYAIELTGNGLSVENFYIENSTYGIVISGDQTEDITISSNWFSDISNTAIYFHWDADVDGCTVTIDDNLIFSSGNGIYMEDYMGLL
ncbi:MAG TPA: DUF1565 domain-containing protein, partial [Synergistales bacterium]|nr:DUF1565 domain-containing protein [Synergistales bacterium]